MATVSPKVLKDCKKKLLDQTKGWTDGVCRGVTMYADDGMQVCGTHTYCHSWVTHAYSIACFSGKPMYVGWQSLKYNKDSRNFLVGTSCSKTRSKTVCSPEACDFLILWMARESPFSQFVLNRDDEDSLLNAGLILLCGPDGLNVAEAMWVCKVLRFSIEGAKASETFMTLVQGGVDPMLAVYVASHIRSLKGAVFGYTGVEGHSTVANDADLLGMLERNRVENADSTSTLFKAVTKVPKGSEAISDPVGKIKGFCKPFIKEDGWGGKIKGEGIEGKELVKRVLEWQAEFKEFIPLDGKLPIIVPPPPLPDSNTVYLELDM